MDKRDEEHRPGLHVVVGRIRDRLEYHCEFVVDGMRFEVDPPSVLGTDHCPATDVPEEWIDQVEVEVDSPKKRILYYERTSEPGPTRPRDLVPWRRT